MEKNPNRQGSFELFYRAGWAYLTVYPPDGHRRELYPEDIENRMKLLGMPPVSARTIRQCIDEATGQPVALAEWPAGQALASTMSVTVEADAMSAAIVIEAPKKGAAAPSLQDVLAQLRQAGVVHGFLESNLQTALRTQAYGTSIQAAAGTKPVSGRGQRIAYRFNVNRGKPYLETDFGRINLRELNFIENVKTGDLLAELEAPIPASDGMTVTGICIPADADMRSVSLSPGQNTKLNPEGDKLFASIDGNVRMSGDMVMVEPVIVVKNVDYSTGNIRFDGSVVVEGSVADGFSVEAGGDIQITSGVGRANLTAGGSILLKTGMNGSGKGVIRCGSDLFAKFLESCSAEAGGSVFVDEAIMNSKVRSGLHCVLGGRRAEVMASEIIAGGSFWCKKLGHYNESNTRIFVGVLPRMLLEYRSILDDMERIQKEWDKSDEQATQARKLLETGNRDERLVLACQQLDQKTAELAAQRAALKAKAPGLKERVSAARSSMAVIEDNMYRGSIITFGHNEYRPPDAGIRKLVLRCRDGIMQEGAFDYRDKPNLEFPVSAS